MRILSKFHFLESFEDFCKHHRAYCPVEEEHKGEDGHKPCHWCMVAYSQGFNAYRNEIEKRLE
jgi:hypothetical protein